MANLCGAKTRVGGKCAQPVAEGRNRCRFHGGKTPRGAASPHFKHGKRMRNLPQRYREVYAAAINDPDLVSLRPQVALIVAREDELLARLDSMESGEAWASARDALADFDQARADRNAEAATRALAELRKAVSAGRGEEAVWREVRTNMEARRRLVDTERRRMEASGAYLTPDEAVAFAGSFVEIIRQEVKDPAVMRRIVGRVQDAFLPTSGVMEVRKLRADRDAEQESEANDGTG